MSIYDINGNQKDFTLTPDQMALLSYCYQMAIIGNSNLELPSFSAYDLGYLRIYADHKCPPKIIEYFNDHIYPMIHDLDQTDAPDNSAIQAITILTYQTR